MNELIHTISNEEITVLPRCAFGGVVDIVESEKDVDRACDYLLSQKAIGFDTETRPSFKAGAMNKVALLQLSAEDRCFLFRLSKMRLDKAIIKVLESKNVLKVGAAVRDDLKALQQLRHFKPDGFVDLQNIVGEWGIEDRSVRKITAIVLGANVSKAQRLSNWEAAQYTPAQVNYAATDAWVCLEVYNTLMSQPKNIVRPDKITE